LTKKGEGFSDRRGQKKKGKRTGLKKRARNPRGEETRTIVLRKPRAQKRFTHQVVWWAFNAGIKNSGVTR